MPPSNLLDEISYIEHNNLKTPVAFFSESNMLKPLDIIRSNLLENTDIYYALKSSYHPPLLKSISSQNVGAEILSEMEFDLAKSFGFKKFIINGMGRDKSFLRKVLTEDSVCIIVDSYKDIANLISLASHAKKEISVGFRFIIDLPNTGTTYYQEEDNKLGNYFEGDLFKKFLELCNRKEFEWDIMHAHFTINELGSEIYLEAIDRLSEYINLLKESSRCLPKRIDLGGGFEVFDPSKVNEFVALFNDISTNFNQKLPNQKLIVEPGRYLSAYAGYTLGKILDIKKLKDKNWIITDIGTNILIPIANARYKLLLPIPSEHGERVGITDGITSPSNNIVKELLLDHLPKIGDYICIGNTGAYTDVYSTFWAYPPHQVVFKNYLGEFKLFRTKEDLQNLYAIFFKEGSLG